MNARRILLRRALLTATATTTALTLAGCGFSGVQNMHLPGGVGNGSNAIKLTVDLPDAGGLVANNQVKVGDVAVGTIDGLTTKDWYAVASVSIEPSLNLPANSVARVGVDSLLGSSYLEIDPPSGVQPQGRLTSGMTIPLSQSHAYPSTEAVLSAASIVLNGGGVAQIGTITRELNSALNGNGQALEKVLPRVNSFMATLNAQKSQIYSAIDSIDSLSTKFANNQDVLKTALNTLAPALTVLNREQPVLTSALESLSKLGTVATPLIESTRTQLVSTIKDLVPVLQQVNSAGNSLVSGLGFAVTFPFAPETVLNACHGDYCNLDLVLDLTNQSLVKGLTNSSGGLTLPGLPGLPGVTLPGLGGLLGGLFGSSTSLGNLGLASTSGASGSSTAKAHGSGKTTTPSNPLQNLLGGLLGGLGGKS